MLANRPYFKSSCYGNYAGVTYGGSITQVLANANVSGYDGEVLNNHHVLRGLV
jgi:hypothetical protein